MQQINSFQQEATGRDGSRTGTYEDLVCVDEWYMKKPTIGCEDSVSNG